MRRLLSAVALIVAAASSHATNICANATPQNDVIQGYNCNIPYDATGPGIYHSERVIGRVTWSAPTKNPHGLYEFTAEYLYFQLKGYSRIKPVVGEGVEVVLRVVLYMGRLRQDR